MANVDVTLLPFTDVQARRWRWEGFAASGDDGDAISTDSVRFSDRTVQVLGSFTGSLAITIQGSLDGGTTWFTLTDPQGSALTFTAAGGSSISEAVPLMRPFASAGSGGGDADVYIFAIGGRG